MNSKLVRAPLFILAASVLAAAGRAAAPIAAESKITGVTVYADRAIVTREATVQLAAGPQEVVFNGLPASLDPDLLQVSGEGGAQATILDVTAATAQLEVAANPRLKELQDQLRALQDDARTAGDRVAVLQQQRDYLERIKAATTTPPGKDAGPLPGIEQWERLMTFYAEGQTRALGELQSLDRQREDLKQRIDAVQRQIGELEAPGERTVQNVTVRCDVASAGPLALRLAYTVAEARWTPTYDVRVASADKSIGLGFAAMVSQSSGEEWRGVKLMLSTARPALGGTAPTLQPWVVEEQRPMPMQAMAAPPPEMRRKSMRGWADKAEPEMEAFAAGVAEASVETGLTSATFTIPYAADIPADNAPHKVAITTHPLEGRIDHLAVPKLAELVYLRAAVTNSSDFPLIAGEVNLFLDGNFVARSRLETVMPGEKFDLEMGVDDAIAVKRKLVNRLTESAGFVSKRTRITYDVLITLQNNRKTAEAVVVKDQVPVSRHEKILVDLLAPPAGEIKKDEDGTISWTLELEPGEKRELPLKIAVEYPVDFAVGGLE